MTEKFKMWLCKLAGNTYFPDLYNDDIDVQLAILVKAMWNINFDFAIPYLIEMTYANYYLVTNQNHEFLYQYNANRNRQEALTEALKFIYKEVKV